MQLGLERFQSEIGRTKHGLSFHADGAALITAFSDELAAYRARKIWVDAFRNYFLLEKDRDYEIWVNPSIQDEQCFVLSACFSSACGRYAFWRLINQQCPEVERKLMGLEVTSRENSSDAKDGGPWVINSECKPRRSRKTSWEICRDVLDGILKRVL